MKPLRAIIIAVIIVTAIAAGVYFYNSYTALHPQEITIALNRQRCSSITGLLLKLIWEEAYLQLSQVDTYIVQKVAGLILASVDAEVAVVLYINKDLEQGSSQ